MAWNISRDSKNYTQEDKVGNILKFLYLVGYTFRQF